MESSTVAPRSWVSDKVEITQSAIQGLGMHARAPITAGEVVFVKGGHIIPRPNVFSSTVINSYQPISDDLVVGALEPVEEDEIKLYVNHSCNPNCGIRGELTFVAIRDIAPGEELVSDYAFIDDEDYSFNCCCGDIHCRRVVTGRDWRLFSVTSPLFNYFAAFLKEKIVKTAQLRPSLNFGWGMPGEYAPHKRTWLLWPTRSDIWRQNAYPAQLALASLANAIVPYEETVVGVCPNHFEQARAILSPAVRLVDMAYDDIWIRDTGPSFSLSSDGDLVANDWYFNAWGGLGLDIAAGSGSAYDLGGSYFPWRDDDMLARRLAEHERAQWIRRHIVLEGGAIAVDGEGTLIAVRESVLNPNRNPGMTSDQVEAILREALGVNRVLWLDNGLAGDETDGHVDNVCMFTGPGRILASISSDPKDPRYEATQRTVAQLEGMRDAQGRSFRINTLELPPAMRMTANESAELSRSDYALRRLQGDLLPASYVNSYVCNGAVIIPQFASAEDHAPTDTDAKARLVFEQAFPERKIVQVPAREFLLGGGGLHCVVQQVPDSNNQERRA